MKRRCTRCGEAQLRSTTHPLKRVLDGRTFAAEVKATRCQACAELLIPGPAALAFERAMTTELASGEVGPEGFRHLRRAAHLQSAELAALLDVSPGTISRWENGKKPLERRAVALVATIALDTLANRGATRELLERLAKGRKPPRRVVLDVSGFEKDRPTRLA